MRTPIVAGNWKMHLTPEEARAWLVEFHQSMPEVPSGVEAVVLPAFPLIPVVAERARESGLEVGSQDVSAHRWGAYTGEVSAWQLVGLGARYAVVGHSERRQYWGETSALISEKARRAAEAGLTPIVCVGEPLEVRSAGEAESYVVDQMLGSLEGLAVSDPDRLVIAYEPVWAIGTGRSATPEDAEAMSVALREALARRFEPDFAGRVRILYGGSVKVENFAAIMAKPNVDGGLVGGASLRAEAFAALVRLAGSGL